MRDITLCHPRLQALTAQLVDKCVSAGLPIKIGESFRSVAEQDALYAQGRTQPGSIVTNARAAAIAASTNGALQWISTGQMEKAPIMSLEIILRKSESLPKSWGLDGAAIGKASWTSHIFICRTGAVVPTFLNGVTAPLRRLKRPGLKWM